MFSPFSNFSTVTIFAIAVVWSFHICRSFLCFWNVRHTVKLKDVAPLPNNALPQVSVLVPACNEGDTVGAALTKLGENPYPALELVVVNDRSRDETPAVIDSFARKFSNIKTLHINSLPERWLGKPHALEAARKSASGDWLLLTDADIHLSRDAITKAVSFAMQNDLDHLAVIPKFLDRGFGIEAAIAEFSLNYLATGNTNSSMRTMPPVCVGVGAFNLVKKTSLEKIGGFEKLKLEVVDDVGLASLIYLHGMRSAMIFGQDCVSLIWYGSTRNLVTGLEKNLCAFLSFRLYNAVFMFLACLVNVTALLTPFFMWKDPSKFVLAIIGYLTFSCFNGAAIAATGLRFKTAFFAPVGSLILGYSCLNSGLKCFVKGGITWRETFYETSTLKHGKVHQPIPSKKLRQQRRDALKGL